MIQGLIKVLIDNVGVQNAVGRNKANSRWKVYPVACPQPEDDPYIVLTITKADITLGKDCDANLDYPSVDVYCYGKNYAKIDELFNSVRDAIHTYSGTSEGYVFSGVHLDDYRDGWVSDVNLYVRIATYKSMVNRVITT